MDRRIATVLERLAKDLTVIPSVESLASSVNLSAYRLRHLFKREVGISLNDFIRQQRMDRARILLSGSFLSVKQVMYAVGLTDETHFIREFKKVWGMTPGAYRRISACKVAPGKSQKSRKIAILADNSSLPSPLSMTNTSDAQAHTDGQEDDGQPVGG